MTYKLPSPDVVLTKSLHDIDAEYYYPDTLRSEIAAAEQRGREQREAELMTVGMEPSLPTHAKGPHFSAEQLAAARLQGVEEARARILNMTLPELASDGWLNAGKVSAVNQGLLEALKNLLAQTGINGTFADKARAAIAAHTGEQM